MKSQTGLAYEKRLSRPKYVSIAQIMTKRWHDNCLHVYEVSKPPGNKRNCFAGMRRNLG